MHFDVLKSYEFVKISPLFKLLYSRDDSFKMSSFSLQQIKFHHAEFDFDNKVQTEWIPLYTQVIISRELQLTKAAVVYQKLIGIHVMHKAKIWYCTERLHVHPRRLAKGLYVTCD